MTMEFRYGILLAAPVLLMLAGLTFAVLTDSYIGRRHRGILLAVVVLALSLLAQNLAEFRLVAGRSMPLVRTLVAIYGYSVRPVILVLFFYVVGRERSYWPAWVLVGLNAAVNLTALFSGICFVISADNAFHRGPLGYSCHIVSGVLLACLVYMTLRENWRLRKRDIWIPLFNAVAVIASVAMDTMVDMHLYPVSFLTIAVVSSIVFYYIWMHLRFVREHEWAFMAEQRMRIMISQIQPHFLFNTLSTIQALCRLDPEKAFDTTEKFGTYLRQNIDSLNQPALIPLKKELEHTRIYADIEIIRFPDIRVEYDIGDDEFLLPALTIQPLVENAIRHGVRLRAGGRVSVVTRRRDDCHEIVIRDNGRGFDAQAVESADETHIGIRNVRERLEETCGGTLTIESAPGEGSAVTIRIPFGGGKGAP